MSLLFSPVVLFVLGLIIAKLAKNKRVWRRHSRFPRRTLSIVLLAYTVVSLGLFVDHHWFASLVARLPGQTGTEWMVNSGVLGLDAAWPLADPAVVVFSVVGFMLFPLWLYGGYVVGQWLFGTNPRQTGVIGLLR